MSYATLATAALWPPSSNPPPITNIAHPPIFLRTLRHSAVQQLRAKREGGLLSVEIQAGEGPKFEQLAQERHIPLPQFIRQLLLQEVYRGKRLTTGGDDKALAEAVAQARGMRHAHTLLRSLLYDEAWRLGIRPQ